MSKFITSVRNRLAPHSHGVSVVVFKVSRAVFTIMAFVDAFYCTLAPSMIDQVHKIFANISGQWT